MRSPRSSDKPSTRTSDRAAQRTILIVDDTEFVRELYSRMLSSAGFQILTASSGREALDILKRERPDLILLDYTMPTMSGPEVLGVLRRRDATKALPVIILTASDAADYVRTGLAAGANDFISKPIARRALLERIELALATSAEPISGTIRRSRPPAK